MAGVKLPKGGAKKVSSSSEYSRYLSATLHNTLLFVVLSSGVIAVLSLSGQGANYNRAYYEHTDLENRLDHINEKPNQTFEWLREIGGVLYSRTGRIFSVGLPENLAKPLSPVLDTSSMCVMRVFAREVGTSPPPRPKSRPPKIEEIQASIQDTLDHAIEPYSRPRRVFELRERMDLLGGLQYWNFDIDRTKPLQTDVGVIEWPDPVPNEPSLTKMILDRCVAPNKETRTTIGDRNRFLYNGKYASILTLWYKKRDSSDGPSIEPDYLTLELEDSRPINDLGATLITIPLQTLSFGGGGMPGPHQEWDSWLEATDQLQFLTIDDAGRVLRERAQSEVDQLYSIQGIPIPTKLLSTAGLTIVALASMWFFVHLRMVASLPKASRDRLPIQKLFQAGIYGSVVFSSVIFMPILASAASVCSSCKDVILSANCILVVMLAGTIAALAVAIGRLGFHLALLQSKPVRRGEF